jgi:UDP-N-acetylglucosamine 3-dehydrogenase
MLNIVLCGLGKMGSNHLRNLKEAEGVKIKAVVDANFSQAQECARTSNSTAYATLTEALAASSYDAAFIVAPTVLHYALAREVLERKIPLFLEKPIARTTQEGEELCRLAEQTGTSLMIGHIERFNPTVVCAKQLISQGDLGEIINISVKRVGGTPQDINGAGDVLVDLAVHDLDIVHWLLGSPPVLIDCVGHREKSIDSATLLLKCADANVDIQVNWVTPIKIREIEITGTKSYLHLNLITQKITLTRQNLNLSTPALADQSFPFDRYLKSFSVPDRTEIGVQTREPLKEEIGAFLNCVRKKLPMPITGKDGLHALRIAEQARKRIEEIATHGYTSRT